MDYIDTHNHMLPGVDDGSPDLQTSIAMARIAVEDGITAVVVTPHIVEGVFSGSDLDRRVAVLQRELDGHGIPLRVVRGAEVPMSLCFSGNSEQLRMLSIAGRYILMETAEMNLELLGRGAYQLRLSGFYPVLAHPERTSLVSRNLDAFQELVEGDAIYCQVSAASMTGIFGSGVQKACERMARRGLVHLLASDAHSTGKRSPRLSQCYDRLVRIAGEKAARVAVYENPLALIEGERLTAPNLPARKPGNPLARIFRRA